MSTNTFNTPILLITFNRPTHTQRVLDEIKKQKPKHLFVFQDGARANNATDKQKCEEVRAIFTDVIDWGCEVKTYYSDINLGCGYGPAKGITWFFDNVEQGIIFEDDCLPSVTLFRFYFELLDKYKEDKRISLITGTNLNLKWKSTNRSYIFSTVGAATMGSWAGWRRSWQFFDYDILTWKNETARKKIEANFGDKNYYGYYASQFDLHCDTKQSGAWDYQWFFARTLNNTFAIVSTVNQMSNIGFGTESTHTPNANDRLANLSIYEMKFPLKHSVFKIDPLFDWFVFYKYTHPKKKTVFLRLMLKVVEKIYCR